MPVLNESWSYNLEVPLRLTGKLHLLKEFNKMDPCVTCNEEVESSHKAMEYNIGERWEYVECVKEHDRLDEQLYKALV